MTMKDKGFFAYGSYPKSSGECIEEAIELINRSDEVDIESWKKLRISGKLIISQIVTSIEKCDFFCADLTGVNDNVMFEVGYAIAKRKALFLINDVSHLESHRKFKELGLLDTTGYNKYTKTEDIVRHFWDARPFDSVDKVLWDNFTSNVNLNEPRVPLLILNGQIDTNINQEVITIAQAYKLPYIIDDASENKVQPLSWYVQQLHNVPAVIAIFSSSSRIGHEIHNAKCAFICGMAAGLGLRVKMIAEKPYETPIDFKELLERIESRSECSKIVNLFLSQVQKDIGELLVRKDVNTIKKKRSQLQGISFGEAIAEHENQILPDYYIEKANMSTLVKNEYNIVVGRKGTGKSATLYYLNELLGREKINHVVIIKPITFEVDGLISLMEASKNEFERGFLIECIWKFLIYSEIGKHLYHEVKNKPLYAISKNETAFVGYIEERPTIFLSDFSTRLEEQIKVLRDNDITDIGTGHNQEYRLKISELLHQGTLGEAREHFAKIIPKNHRLVVLIDNLDKSWRPNSKINILSRYILGLLGVSGRIVKELSVVKSIQTNLSFHLTLFLRSDIFRYIMASAREPDKLEITRLKWDDRELLFRIIEERFVQLSDGNYSGDDLWDKFVCKSVDYIDVKDYIMDIIFPRPRDIIYLIKAAKDKAVSRGHLKIEPLDIKSAYHDYSAWVFRSVIVENGITLKQMEDFMYELMGSNIFITRDDILKKMILAKIDSSSDAKIDGFIDHLVDLTIVGREVKVDEFEFEYDADDAKKLKALSKKISSNRYRIHNALIPYLECVF